MNGVVDGADLTRLLGAWGSDTPALDLVRNGTIDGANLASLLESWD